MKWFHSSSSSPAARVNGVEDPPDSGPRPRQFQHAMNDDFYDDSSQVIGHWAHPTAYDDFFDDTPEMIGTWSLPTHADSDTNVFVDAPLVPPDESVENSHASRSNIPAGDSIDDDFWDDSSRILGEWARPILPVAEDDFFDDSPEVIGHWSALLVEPAQCQTTHTE